MYLHLRLRPQLMSSHRIFLMIQQIHSSRNRMMDLQLTWKQILKMEMRSLPETTQLLTDFSTLRPVLLQQLPSTTEQPQM